MKNKVKNKGVLSQLNIKLITKSDKQRIGDNFLQFKKEVKDIDYKKLKQDIKECEYFINTFKKELELNKLFINTFQDKRLLDKETDLTLAIDKLKTNLKGFKELEKKIKYVIRCQGKLKRLNREYGHIDWVENPNNKDSFIPISYKTRYVKDNKLTGHIDSVAPINTTNKVYM